jgi:hypothetical protein
MQRRYAIPVAPDITVPPAKAPMTLQHARGDVMWHDESPRLPLLWGKVSTHSAMRLVRK